mmetsp:Transcript_38232/g.106328  ORF Transcript_38232/g.106328 Transcript_38232/m.106328 type:complete len:95 (+) Transcript_38232:93-377(+)
MLFYRFFQSLEGKEVVVELKNDFALRGVLHSVDQYINLKLENVRVVDEAKHPQLLSVKNVFVRGNVVRYVHLPPDAVDTEMLQDAARKEAAKAR